MNESGYKIIEDNKISVYARLPLNPPLQDGILRCLNTGFEVIIII